MDIGVDKYTYHLRQLSKLTNEQLLTCNGDLTSLPRKWGHELIKSISPPLDQQRMIEQKDKEIADLKQQLRPHLLDLRNIDDESKRRAIIAKRKEISKPAPLTEKDKSNDRLKDTNYRYVFLSFVYKSKVSLICLTRDDLEHRHVIFKFCLPTKIPDTQRIKKPTSQPKEPEKKNIFVKCRDFVVNACMEELTPAKEDEHYGNESTRRFERSIRLQKQLYFKIRNKGLDVRIPEIYHESLDQHLWCAMEYINGQDLICWCQQNSADGIVGMFAKVIEAVEMVHNSRVVHSDIKPGNFLVLNNKPVLFDFGFSFNVDDHAARVTAPGTQNVGTPAYSDPDHQMGNSADRDFQDDMFALGRTFWSMWNQGEADTDDVLIEDLGDGRIDYDETAKEAMREKYPAMIFPDEERAIFERAVNKDRSIRYTNISDLKHDVELLLMKKYGAGQRHACVNGCEQTDIIQRQLKLITDKYFEQEQRTHDLEQALKDLKHRHFMLFEVVKNIVSIAKGKANK